MRSEVRLHLSHVDAEGSAKAMELFKLPGPFSGVRGKAPSAGTSKPGVAGVGVG